ncbi:MAG TPA: serine hydrolase domain-containing protein, partial [Thermoanaerobaculia bacterium]
MRSRARSRAALSCLFLSIAATALAAEKKEIPPEQLRAVESAIAATIQTHRVPGLSAAVVQDGELRWSKGYGFADLENFVPFTATTVHRLGSVSKTMTAVAAMQLAERGRLDLDRPIQEYCPAFPKKPWPITSRQLLGHLSG